MQMWKYPIPPEGAFVIEMPAYASIVHIDIQNSIPVMWALVKPENIKVMRTFHQRGTGQDIPNGLVHIGSYMLTDGSWEVYHLFEHPLARIGNE